MQRKCIFVNLMDNDLPSFELDKEERIYLGRNKLTKIKDSHLSKLQVSVKPNLAGGYLLIKPEGTTNPSGLNGFALESHLVYTAQHGDVLELLLNNYKYRIEFHPPPAAAGIEEECIPSKKGKIDPSPAAENSWSSVDNGKLLIFTGKGVVASSKIASYDVDGTIIKTKSGNVFPKNMDDWQIAFSEVPGKLKSLHQQGFKIVFFTNQAGISSGKTKAHEFKSKLERIVGKLGVPVQAFVATGKGKYRKPLTGMWDMLCAEKNDAIEIEKSRSFFVGDAAGRPEQKLPIKRKKDHSSADRLMAINVEIPFFTPEQHFLSHKDSEWVKPEFNPKDLDFGGRAVNMQLAAATREVIIMVGFPGSGKSHFAKQHLETAGYKLINRDTLGSWQKCVSVLEKTLADTQENCVIDNTNPDAESRKRFIDVAKKFKVPIRCFIMDVPYKQCRHNNAFRELVDPTHVQINDMVFNMYKSKYQEPNLAEGFQRIVKVTFVPSFQKAEHEKLYKLYLLEK